VNKGMYKMELNDHSIASTESPTKFVAGRLESFKTKYFVGAGFYGIHLFNVL